MPAPAEPSPRSRHDLLRHLLRWVAPLLVVVGAVAVRVWVRGALTLADLPGPGGVKVLAALGVGHTGRDWTTWLVAAVLPLVGGDMLAAAAVVMVGSTIAAVIGAMLAGRAIGGRDAALAAGTVAAVWSQMIHPAVVIGADGVAMGASWLGVGLVWFGCGRVRRLPLAVVGAGLLHFSLMVKVTAAPAVALVVLTPLVAGSPLLAIAGVLLGGVVLGTATLGGPGATAVGFTWPRGAADALLSGHPEGYLFGVLGMLAMGGALVPGRRWPARVALWVGLMVTLDVAAQSGGLKARPRHLATGALGLVVLSGWLVGAVPGVVTRVASARGPTLWRYGIRAARVVPLVVLVGMLGQESLGFFHGWAALRSHYLAESACDLPRPRTAWLRLYDRLSTHAFTDHSDPGADVLVELGRTAPAGGVATVVLRDNREFHLLAGAAVGDRPATILHPGKCCRGEVSATCARSVVSALDRAGALVVLPTDVGLQRTPRVNHPHDRFMALLLQELDTVESRTKWWRVWQGSGSGGPLPCSQGVGR